MESFVEVVEKMVYNINMLFCKQAERFVITNTFTDNCRRILEDKDEK